jgi:hypothetical protein
MAVTVNHERMELRDDETLYLGMLAWYRVEGERRWTSTNGYGRAKLTPGTSYEMIFCLEGSSPDGFLYLLFDRIRRLIWKT